MRLDTDIIDILASSEVRGNVLFLTSGQLDRKTYERLNKALVALGGKWNKREKGHVFEGDPTVLIENALQTGTVTDLRHEFDFFQTPRELAVRMVQMACDGLSGHALEPSAGTGAIADEVLRRTRMSVALCELSERNRTELSRKGYECEAEDFLTFEPGRWFDAIVANPPFSKQQDIHHVNHMLDMLKPGGRLVSVMSSGVTFRTNRLANDFRERVASLGGEIEHLPAGTFRSSGTDVNTVLVKVGVQ